MQLGQDYRVGPSDRGWDTTVLAKGSTKGHVRTKGGPGNLGTSQQRGGKGEHTLPKEGKVREHASTDE